MTLGDINQPGDKKIKNPRAQKKGCNIWESENYSNDVAGWLFQMHWSSKSRPHIEGHWSDAVGLILILMYATDPEQTTNQEMDYLVKIP